MKYLLFLYAASLMALISCGSETGPGEPGAVITVQGRSVLADDVSSSFETYRGDTTSVNVLRDNILARELFLAHARELGFDEDREVQRLIHERRREILQSAWLSSELDKVSLEEGMVRSFWNDLGTGVAYTALTLRDSLLMDSVSALVHEGGDLSELARTFGLEDLTRTTAGYIQIPDRLYANLMDIDYLENPVPGNVIGPFPVPIGNRIIRIDSVWTYEPERFENDSLSIQAMLLARHRELRKQFVEDSLKTARNVTVNMEAIDLLSSRGNGIDFQPFTDEEQNITVVEWDGGSRDIYSVYMNIINLPGYLPRETDDPYWLVDYARRLAMFDIEMELGLSAGLDTVEEVADRLEVKELETLLDSYYEQIIAPAMQPDSALLHEIYLEIREDEPIQETRIFNVLFLPGTDRIQAAEELMANGGDMLENPDEFEIFPPILATGEQYVTIPISRAMVPEADRESLFGLEPGEETLVAVNDTTSLWFRLITVNPEHIPEFGELRDRVLSVAEQRLETEVIGGLVDSLEAVYHPYVDQEFFRGFYTPAESDSITTADETEEVTDAL